MKLIKKIGFLTLVATLAISASSCLSVTGSESSAAGREEVTGSGSVVTKDITLASGFSEISVPSIIDVVVTQGTANSVKLEGYENLLKYCNIKVSGNTLVIGLTKEGDRISFKKFNVKAYVSAKTLSEVNVSGTGDVEFKGTFNTDGLNLGITGTGDITIPDLSATTLKASISGTGDIKLKGTCGKAWFEVSGTGDIQAALSTVNTVEASVSGTGDIELSGTAKNAIYTASGTGDIEAKEMIAKSVTATASGTGEIECYASESFSGVKATTADLKCYGNPAKYNLQKN